MIYTSHGIFLKEIRCLAGPHLVTKDCIIGEPANDHRSLR